MSDIAPNERTMLSSSNSPVGIIGGFVVPGVAVVFVVPVVLGFAVEFVVPVVFVVSVGSVVPGGVVSFVLLLDIVVFAGLLPQAAIEHMSYIAMKRDKIFFICAPCLFTLRYDLKQCSYHGYVKFMLSKKLYYHVKIFYCFFENHMTENALSR